MRFYASLFLVFFALTTTTSFAEFHPPKLPEKVEKTFLQGLYSFASTYVAVISFEKAPSQKTKDIWFSAMNQEGLSLDQEDLELCTIFASSYYWRLSMMEAQISEKEIQESWQKKEDRESVNRWFIGGRFLLPKGAEELISPAEVGEILLESQGEEEFRNSSESLNRRLGILSDGWLGFRQEGKINPELFELIHSQEVNQVSGPFDSPNGQLFLWLSDKGDEGTMPLRLIKDQLVEEINQARINQAVTPLLQKHEGIVHESVIEKAFEPDTLAYSIGSTTRTLAQAQQRVFSFVGDPSNPEYRLKLARRALENEVLYLSLNELGEDVRIQATEIGRRLAFLHSLQSQIDQRYKEKLAAIEFQELKDHYEANKFGEFSAGKSYPIILFLLSRNPERLAPGPKSAAASLEAWKNVQSLREQARSLGEVEEMLAFGQGKTGFRVNNMSTGVRALANYPDSIQAELKGMEAGDWSEVIITPGSYQFFKLLEISEAEPIPFSEIFERIHYHYNDQLRIEIVNDSLKNGLQWLRSAQRAEGQSGASL